MNPITPQTLDDALDALAAFLEDAKATPEHLVLIGGAALLALGLVSRTTRDVDIMAGVDARSGLVDPRPLSEALKWAAEKWRENSISIRNGSTPARLTSYRQVCPKVFFRGSPGATTARIS